MSTVKHKSAVKRASKATMIVGESASMFAYSPMEVETNLETEGFQHVAYKPKRKAREARVIKVAVANFTRNVHSAHQTLRKNQQVTISHSSAIILGEKSWVDLEKSIENPPTPSASAKAFFKKYA
jgi:hypothetical protein